MLHDARVQARATFEATVASVDDVEGWMTPDQARRLWDRASELHAGERVVEIGSFRGRSAIVLARAAADGVEVVAIDPHAGNDRGPQEIAGKEAEAEEDNQVFHRNLAAAGVADRIRHLRLFSDAALTEVPGPVHLLYIDGAHRWRPAAADIRQWGAKVPTGGHMLIHDSFSSIGVTAAIATELLTSADWRYEGRSQSMTQYRRVREQGARARLRNAARQLAELPWFLRNVLIKVLIVLRLGRLTRLLGHPSGDWPY
jgi:predicted O-methyltransferase YrrM